MPKDHALVGRRSVGEIEGDLLSAEAAYADADARLKEAQSQQQAALEAINKHQAEFDQAIAQLRQHSAPGSRWSAGGTAGEVLMLGPSQAIPAPAENIHDTSKQLPKPQLRTVSAQFDQLRSVLESQAPDRKGRQQES